MSEYSYLLPDVSVSSAKLALLSSDCYYASSLQLEGLPVHTAARFQKSVLFYDSARLKLSRARLLSSVHDFLVGLPLAKPAAVLACHSLVVQALNDASSAARAALETLDSQLAEFDALQDESDDFAQGVRNELEEIDAQVMAGDASGNSLGQRIVSVSSKLRALNDDYLANLDMLSVIGELAGKDSVLSEAFRLSSRIDGAIREMHSADLRLQGELEEAFLQATLDAAAVKKEELASIREEKIYVEFEGLIDASSLPPSFADAIASVEEKAEKAKLLAKQAAALSSSKQRGYLGRALVKRRQALSFLEEAHDGYVELLSHARSLKATLERQAGKTLESLRGKIEQKRGQPLSYALLQSMLADYEKLRQEYFGRKTLGDEINYLLLQLDSLQGIASAADAGDAYSYAHAEAKGRVQRLAALLSKAEKDGIDATVLKQRLSAASGSLDSLSFPSESNYVAVKKVLADADALEGELRAMVLEEFGGLEEGFSFASSIKKFLSAEEKTLLSKYSSFFVDGKLDALGSVGSLSSARAFFDAVRDRFESRKDELLQAELEKSMEVTFSVPFAELGSPSKILAIVSFENSLPLASEEKFYVALPFDSPDARLLNSSPGLSLGRHSNGLQAVFSSVEEKRYSMAVSYSAAIARLVSETERTLAAREDYAEKELSISFEAALPATVVISRKLPEKASYSVSYAGAFKGSYSDGVLSIELDAFSGKNTLMVRYFSSRPFSIFSERRVDSEVDGKPTALSYWLSYTNDFADLQYAELSFQDALPCSPKSVELSSPSLSARHEAGAGMLAVKLSSREWKKGEEKSAVVRVACGDFLESAVFAKLEELQARAAILSEPSVERELLSAKSLAGASKWSEALDALYSLEQDVSEAEKRAITANNASAIPFSPSLAAATAESEGNVFAGAEPLDAVVEDELPEKLAVLRAFSSSRPGFVQAIEDYRKFFYSAGAPRLALAKAAAESYRQASKSLANLDAALRHSEDAEKLAKYSAGSLSNDLETLKSSSAALSSANSEIRKMALEAADAARKRSKQFGSREDKGRFDRIEESLSSERYLEAYALAEELNSSLVPQQRDAAVDYLWLAPVGLAALLGIALARNHKLKRID